MFQIGFCYPMDWDPRDLRGRLALLKGFGFDGVEFWPVHLDRIAIDEFADALAEAGLRCAQVCPYFDFVHGQEKWDETMRIAERYVAWSNRLGQPLVRVFTGGGVGPADATPEQWDAAVTGLQRICDMAAPHGIRLALECHTGSLMEDSPSALRLLSRVNRPNLGANLQLPLRDGHEPIDTSLLELGRHTWHMHAHNYTSIPPGEQRPLGEGVLDYRAILTRLIHDGFNGYVSIEHATYNRTRDPWDIAKIEGAYLTKLRERITTEDGYQ